MATLSFLPSLRLRHLLVETIDVTHLCHVCGYEGPLDAVMLYCRVGPFEPLTEAISQLSCPRCGRRDGSDWSSSPRLLRYAAKVGHVVSDRVKMRWHCTACRRSGMASALDLAQTHGPDVTLGDLGDALQCPGCGRAGWLRVEASEIYNEAAGTGGAEAMCGRYAQHSSPDLIAARFALSGELPELKPTYNAAPTQSLPVIRRHPKSGIRTLSLLRWGLVPQWAKDLSGAAKNINARAETVAEKPTFREAFQQRRALVPFDAFYEWQKRDDGKQPFAFATDSNGPDAFAGLWTGWKEPQGTWVHSFCIITTRANGLVGEVHDRMPVILPPESWGPWLGEEPTNSEALLQLLQPYPVERMKSWPVSRAINSVSNDGPELMSAVDG
jgi:putative SOS response-associated peptidase YedK